MCWCSPIVRLAGREAKYHVFINWKEGKHMDNKINKLLGYLTGLFNSDIDRIIDYVIQILNVNN